MALKIVPNTMSANGLVAIQQVRAYWEALRGINTLPHREQIDPRGLCDALDKVFLIERIAPGQARFRIAGTQLHDLMGMDLRGMPLSTLVEPAARLNLSESLESAFRKPAVIDIWLKSERALARAALDARMVLLPLASAHGDPNLILGCLAVEGTIGRTPRRFMIDAIVEERIGNSPAFGHSRLADPAHLPPDTTRHRNATPLRLVSSRD